MRLERKARRKQRSNILRAALSLAAVGVVGHCCRDWRSLRSQLGLVPPHISSAIGHAFQKWGVEVCSLDRLGFELTHFDFGGHLAAADLEADVLPRLVQHGFYVSQGALTADQCAKVCVQQPRRLCNYDTVPLWEYPPNRQSAGGDTATAMYNEAMSTEGLVVVSKPWGVRAHLAKDENGRPYRVWPEERTVADWYCGAHPGARPFFCNRLDFATSGAMLVARSREVSKKVQRFFVDGLVDKTYLALVLGHPPSDWDAGVRLAYELMDTEGFARRAARRKDGEVGQTAETLVKVIQRGLWPSKSPAVTLAPCESAFDFATSKKQCGSDALVPLEAALVEVKLLTGRRHQIRVHLAAAGHPILGDDAYGGNPWGIRGGSYRMFLHSYRVELPLWDGSGGRVSVEAPCDFCDELF